MKVVAFSLVLVLVISNAAAGVEAADPTAERMRKWQEYLEDVKFWYPDPSPTIFSSIELFSADYQIQLTFDPRPKRDMKLSFLRDGNVMLELEVHWTSVFRSFDDKLYFARFWSTSPGCTIEAYDLRNGKELWKTGDVSKLRQGGASAYGNQVFMRLSRRNEVADEPEGAALIITGREGFGDYISILDRQTGTELAHRIYSTGFGPKMPSETPVIEEQD